MTVNQLRAQLDKVMDWLGEAEVRFVDDSVMDVTAVWQEVVLTDIDESHFGQADEPPAMVTFRLQKPL